MKSCCPHPLPENRLLHQGGHATARFLEGFLDGSLKEVLLRRVLRRHPVRVSAGTEVLRRLLRRRVFYRRCLEGA